VVLVTGANRLFLLIKDIDPALSRFIYTGHPKKVEYQTLPDAEMEALERTCLEHGLAVTYRSHRMEYMHEKATISYPHVSNATTGMNISLIPWFQLPEHPFPIFVYAYAAWHYRETDRASQQGTADATGRLFGIESFHKSTVSRNIGLMEDSFRASLESCGSAPESREAPSPQELAGLIPMILGGGATIGILEELYGDKVRRVNGGTGGTAPCAMDAIPHEYSNVIRAKRAVAGGPRRDGRKRPARPRRKSQKGEKGGRPRPESVESAQIEKIRNGFITALEQLVIGAAMEYHRILTQLGSMPATTPNIKIHASRTEGGGTKRPGKTHRQG